MASLFSKIVSSSPLTGALSGYVNSAAANTMGEVNQQLAELKSMIALRQQSSEQLVALMSATPELFEDCEVDSEGSPLPIVTDRDSAITIIDTVNSLYPDGLTITSSNGEIFNLKSDLGYTRLYFVNGNGSAISDLVYIDSTDGYILPLACNVGEDGVTKQYVSMASIVGDLVENSEIYDFLSDVSQTFSAGGSRTQATAAALSKWGSSKFSSVKQMTTQVFASYNNGGVAGVVQFLHDFLSGASTITDDDGLITFSDNSTVVPRVFLSGVLPAIISAASTVATVVATVINPMLGVVVGLVCTIGNTIVTNINQSQQQENAAIVDSEQCFGDMAPHSLFQIDMDLNASSENEDIRRCFEQLGPALSFSVPGGRLLVSRAGGDPDPHYRLEFHPSILCSTSFRQLLRNRIEAMTVVTTQLDAVYSMKEWFFPPTDDARLIEEAWANATSSLTYTNDQTGRLNYDQSNELRRSITTNILGFYLWLQAYYCARWQSNNPAMRICYNHQDDTMIGPESYPSYYPYRENGAFVCADIAASAGWVPSGTVYNAFGSWQGLGYLTIWAASAEYDDLMWVGPLMDRKYFGAPAIIPSSYAYAVETPKYTQGSVWLSVAIAAVVTVVTITATALLYRWTQRKKAYNAARVNHAYQNYADNPTSANYAAYRKAVKANNRWATILGGTKFSMTDYWFPEASNSAARATGIVGSMFSQEEVGLADILTTITGSAH